MWPSLQYQQTDLPNKIFGHNKVVLHNKLRLLGVDNEPFNNLGTIHALFSWNFIVKMKYFCVSSSLSKQGNTCKPIQITSVSIKGDPAESITPAERPWLASAVFITQKRYCSPFLRTTPCRYSSSAYSLICCWFSPHFTRCPCIFYTHIF